VNRPAPERLAAALVLAAGAWMAWPYDGSLALAAVPDSLAAAQPVHADSTAPHPSFQKADWETLATVPEEARLSLVYGFRYNRVDGPAPTIGGAVRSERSPNPLVYAKFTYAFSRERFLYDAGGEAPIGDRARFKVGGAAYRRTATEDAWIVGEVENTLYALFARTDYRDYYEASGYEGRLAWEPGTDFGARVEARVEDQRSLENEANASLFGAHDRFRPNPPIDDGQDGVLALGMRIGPMSIPSEGGTHGDVVYERAGDAVHGDFDYGRVRAVVRTRIRLSPKQDARARLVGGSTLDGTLPPQKVWYVGGISTLRGEDFKERPGDQFLLANAEYYLLVRKNVWSFAFLDWGSAWFGRDNLDRQQFLLDGGLGVRIGQGPLALLAARNLQESDAAIHVLVRFSETF
jgi:hypothetical protein